MTTADTVTVSGGKVSFERQAGESFTIAGLPAGAEFTLTETSYGKADTMTATAENAEGEIAVEGFSVSGKTRATWQEGAEAPIVTTVTVTNVYKGVEITVEKVWEDADDTDGIRPESVNIKLLAGGETVNTVELNEANEWQHTFTELPKYENGEEIAYTVEEAEVPEGYEAAVSGDAESGFIVTNTHEPEEPEEVDYTEHYKYEGENLPKDVLDTLPTRADRYKDGATVIPADPSHKEIPVEGGKWVFKGWDQDKAVVDGDDVYFVGTWEFLADPVTPRTGDNSMTGLWLTLMCASMTALAGVTFFGKRTPIRASG